MKVIVGLGNPGHTYHETRHNMGFMVIQALAERRHVSVCRSVVSPADQRPAAVFGDDEDGAEPVRLLMPLTMMNESGEAMRVIEAPRSNLLIVCDDVNLPLGTIRLRLQGGAGGHHGLQSCLDALGTEEVPRLRIGVGIEPLPADLEQFVLSRFSSAERSLMKQAIEQGACACETWVTEGMEMAMNRYNRSGAS